MTTDPQTPAPEVSDLIATLRHRAPRLALAVAAGQTAWSLAKTLHAHTREKSRFTVKVQSTDDIYDDLHEWVLGMLPDAEQRALVAWTAKRRDNTAGDSTCPPTGRLRLRYDGSREQTLRIGGHRIKVFVSDGETSERNAEWVMRRPAEIVFTAPSLAARDALIATIADVARRSIDARRKPLVRVLNRWGEWTRLDHLPVRDLDSVVLPAGQLDRIVGDVAEFLASEEVYQRRCIPWHRGHLYEGPPGTGKTSTALAIANHFSMDVWYLPLSDVQRDCDLIRAMSVITPRSMLLLEDVDVFHAATTRTDGDTAAVTMSGLLNALDGITTPHGLLTVLTTNHVDALDRAVIRSGRVDRVEHFGLADAAQVARMLERWFARSVDVPVGLSGVAPVEVVEACKRHADDPAAAVAALIEKSGSPGALLAAEVHP